MFGSCRDLTNAPVETHSGYTDLIFSSEFSSTAPLGTARFVHLDYTARAEETILIRKNFLRDRFFMIVSEHDEISDTVHYIQPRMSDHEGRSLRHRVEF